MKGTSLTAIAIAVAALVGGPARAEDLLQTYREARGYDAQYAAALASLDAGREKRPQGLALLLPTVNAGANTNWNVLDQNVPPPPRVPGQRTTFDYNSNGWFATLTQPVFRWQNIVQYQQSEFQVMQAEAQFANAAQDLIVRTAQAYFDTLAAQDNLDFVRSQRRAIAEQLAQAKRNFEVGTATITDTNEAQARFDLNTAQEIAALNDLEVRRRALTQLIGRLPERLAPLRSGVLLEVPGPNNLDEWSAAAAGQNYNVRVQEAAWAIAKKEIERQRAGHLPTLDAVATYQQNVGQNVALLAGQRSQVDQQIYGLQVNVPIFAGGSVLSRTREAAANAEKARQDLESARRVATLDAQRSFLSVSNGLAQVKALEQALVSSEVSLASNRVGYEVGVRINIDVLNAEQQVTSTRRDLSRSRYDTILNGLKLKAATGTLSEEDVIRVNELLGPEIVLTTQLSPVTPPTPPAPRAPETPSGAASKTNASPPPATPAGSTPGATPSKPVRK